MPIQAAPNAHVHPIFATMLNGLLAVNRALDREQPRDYTPPRTVDELTEPEWEKAQHTATEVVDLLRRAEKLAGKLPEEWRDRHGDDFHDGLFALMLMLDPYWRP